MTCRVPISLSALLLATCSAAGRPYLVTDLGDLGFGESRAYRINAAGEVAGWSTTIVDSHAVRHAFLYSGGTMHDLATGALGLGFSEAWGINDAGEVVGKAENAAGKTRAFMYSGGTMAEVDPGLGGATSVAYAINDAGQVAGFAARKYTLLSYDHAFRWTDGNDNGAVDPLEVLELLALDGNTTSRSYARDVNNAGQVVGYSKATTYDHGFFFSDANGNGQVDAGELADLGTFGGNASVAYGINDAGQVAGGAQTSGGDMRAFVWTDLNGDGARGPGEMAELGTLGGDDSRAHGINSHGHVVGYAQINAVDTRAFLYKDGTMHDLNVLLEPAPGWVLQEAWDINDAGQITGFGKNPSTLTHAFLLTPATYGDANLDRTVDILDLVVCANNFNATGATWGQADFNGDGTVGVLDLVILANNFGSETGVDAGPIPEPASASLLVMGLGVLLARPRRRDKTGRASGRPPPGR